MSLYNDLLTIKKKQYFHAYILRIRLAWTMVKPLAEGDLEPLHQDPLTTQFV